MMAAGDSTNSTPLTPSAKEFPSKYIDFWLCINVFGDVRTPKPKNRNRVLEIENRTEWNWSWKIPTNPALFDAVV